MDWTNRSELSRLLQCLAQRLRLSLFLQGDVGFLCSQAWGRLAAQSPLPYMYQASLCARSLAVIDLQAKWKPWRRWTTSGAKVVAESILELRSSPFESVPRATIRARCWAQLILLNPTAVTSLVVQLERAQFTTELYAGVG